VERTGVIAEGSSFPRGLRPLFGPREVAVVFMPDKVQWCVGKVQGKRPVPAGRSPVKLKVGQRMTSPVGDSEPPWGDRLRLWRIEVKAWSQQELVDHVVQLAFQTKENRGTRLEVRLVGKWENGKVKTPQSVYRRLLKQLGAPMPPVHLTSTPVAAAELPPESPPSNSEVATEVPGGRTLGHGLTPQTLVGEMSEEDDMRRRVALGLPALPLLGGVLSSAEPVRRRVDAALSFPTTEHDVTEGEQVADEYARLVNQVPAERLFPQLLPDLDEFQGRVESANDDLKPRLARVCALLNGIAAISLLHAGYWLEADRYWRTARRTATYSGDSVLGSLISGRRAVHSMCSPGRSRSSVLSLADDALAMGADTPSSGTASGWAARAQVLALYGDRSGARDALSRLEAEFERLPEATRADTTTLWGWSERRLLQVRSFTHSYTGDVREAEKAQDAVLPLYPPSSWGATSWGAAQVRFHQAACMIVSGDPSQGARHIVEVFEAIPPEFRNGDLKSAAGFALEKLPGHAERIPAVRQARELMGSTTYI
jgi:hypothetical protein